MAENGGAVHLELERKLRLRLEPPPPLPTALRRRHSIAAPAAPAAKPPAQSLSFPNGTSASHPPLPPPLDLSGHDFPSYTTLRDLLPPSPAASSPAAAASAASPTSAASSSYEISIRNRLVNRAAWAYLRPVSASPDATGPTSSAASGSASPPASGSSAGPSAGSPASSCRSAPIDSRGAPPA